jgi:hypothetical protein
MKSSTEDHLVLVGMILLFVVIIVALYFHKKEPAPVQSNTSWYEYDRCVGTATRLGQPMTPCADMMPPCGRLMPAKED